MLTQIENPNINVLDDAPPVLQPCANRNATALTHGQLVCRDIAASDSSSAFAQRVKQIAGVISPASANAHLMAGILSCGGKNKTLGTDQVASLCTGGICQALVTVPAGVNLTAGNLLAPYTTWNSSTHVVTWGTSLAPVVYNGVIQTPGNPFALNLEAYDNSGGGAAVTTLMWVSVIPDHKPRLSRIPYYFPGGNTTTKARQCFARALGPGAIVGVIMQMLNDGSAGDLTLDTEIHPLLGTVDSLSIWTTGPKIVNDGTDGVIAGCACSLQGDNDSSNSVGTGGSNGVLKALASRQFPTLAVLSHTLTYSSGTAQADLGVIAEIIEY